MLRGMVFIDHMNFDIGCREYYRSIEKQSPRLDYNKLFAEVVGCFPAQQANFLKGYLFVPKPDDFLMKDLNLAKYYKWVSGMQNAPFTKVVDGRYVGRSILGKEKDINDPSTYYKVEKGTDINLAIHALSKAFFNAYDVGFFLSADTDYISLYKMLSRIGKIVVQVAVKGQATSKIRPYVDYQIVLEDEFFQKCLRDS